VILFTTSCSPVDKPSFPVELFQKRVPTIDNQGCSISLSSVTVILPAQNNGVPILHVQGSLSTACSDLQVGFDPPDLNHDILVNLKATPPKGGTPSPSAGLRSFDITYKLDKLHPGSYSVYINGNLGTEFTIP
jgi:hypothetical protein